MYHAQSFPSFCYLFSLSSPARNVSRFSNFGFKLAQSFLDTFPRTGKQVTHILKNFSQGKYRQKYIFLEIDLSILFPFFTGWALSTDPLDLDISYRIHYKHQQFTDVKTISQSDPAYILKVTTSF